MLETPRFRQTRFTDHVDRLRLRIADRDCQVKNWSRTGIAFETSGAKPFQVGDSVDGVRIECGEILIFEGTVRIRFAQPIEGGQFYYGASFDGSLFLVDGVLAAISAQDFTRTLEISTRAIEDLTPEVCQSLVAIRSALRQLRLYCDKTERKWRDLSFDSRCEAERIWVPHVSHKVSELFTYFNLKVARQLDIDKLSNNSLYHQIFAEEAAPAFEAGDIPRRALVKPLGYAGDYEMMNQLYRSDYQGSDLYGRVMNYYVANDAAANSVRFRKDYFLERFMGLIARKTPVSILSVACGPAVEVQELCRRTPADDLDRVRFTLFDLDREALEHAQTKIYETALATQKRMNLEFVNASVKTFLSSHAALGGQFDLIYSAGLFDYLDNLTAGALVRHFARMLLPNGKLVLGNFTKNNPTKAFCHLILNWNLIHKTEEDILGWAEGIKGCSMTIEYDPLKINAFLVITKNAAG